MSWNDNLYLYAKDRDLEYIGGLCQTRSLLDDVSGWDGMLLLEHKGQPLIVSCRTVGGGRAGEFHYAQALLRCTLDRPYFLNITPKSATRKGMNAVLGQLDKGVELLNKNVDLYRDYGCPEVTEGRSIKTDDPEFTQMVFRDLEFRNLLLKTPRLRVRVESSAPEFMPGQEHLIRVDYNLGGGLTASEEDWYVAEPDSWLDDGEKLIWMRSRNFASKLEGMISLAKAAHGAVTAWRMPAKNC